nr:AbrB/MazE/SpoVT family DNA-binding domain-containing protein [Roseomonas rosulenta]
MRVIVRKWGNGAAVRIPASVMAAAHLTFGQPVELRVEAARIIIEPVRPERYVRVPRVGRRGTRRVARGEDGTGMRCGYREARGTTGSFGDRPCVDACGTGMSSSRAGRSIAWVSLSAPSALVDAYTAPTSRYRRARSSERRSATPSFIDASI